ncbi:MAG: peptidase family protein [Solirubrobacterales bacterium]|nr:peptidase family protein [Solirubrobacterales bacterium]
MPISETLRRLLTAPGPSGYETPAAQVWREAAGAFAEVTTNTMGSSIARVPGTDEGPTIAVMGHIDEIGVMVRHIDEKGYLRISGVGGWDPTILAGQRVDVLGRGGRLPGVVGKKPIHLMDSDERTKAPELKDLYVDIGAASEEEARGLVREGDVAVIAAEPVELPNGRLISRALDNRLGCFIALRAAELVAEAGGAPGDFYAVASVQEETDLAGARAVAFALEPAAAIVVDVTFASDQHGVDPDRVGKRELGSGPSLGRGSMLHPKLFEVLSETAEAESIAYTIEAYSRYTSTDADAVHLTRAGIPTMTVGVPTRYLHSPIELVQMSDVEDAARLIAAAARRLEPDTSFER